MMSTESVNINDLISVSTFLREIRMSREEFMRFRHSKRIDGVISIAGRNVIDRSKVNIRFMRGGDKFKLWLQLGGRTKPVIVPKDLKQTPQSSLHYQALIV